MLQGVEIMSFHFNSVPKFSSQSYTPFTRFTLAVVIVISKEVVAIVTGDLIPWGHVSEHLDARCTATCGNELDRGEGETRVTSIK